MSRHTTLGAYTEPQGMDQIGVDLREACGVMHNRDVNAAKNILAVGHDHPVMEVLVLQGRKDVNELTVSNLNKIGLLVK